MHKKLWFFLLIVFIFIIHSTNSEKKEIKCFHFLFSQKQKSAEGLGKESLKSADEIMENEENETECQKERLKGLLRELLRSDEDDENIMENEEEFLDEIFEQKSDENEQKSEKKKFFWNNKGKIINLSNASPCNIREESEGSGKWTTSQGSGGLVTCVEPVLATTNHGRNVWIFSHMIRESQKSTNHSSLKEHLFSECKYRGYKMNPVFVTENDYAAYYEDISNGLLWPGLHNMPNYIREDYKSEERGHLRTHQAWAAYVRVNFKFAVEALRQKSSSHDFIWVHDYHLMLVGLAIRTMAGGTVETGFFLHIPFQPPIIARYPKIARAIFRGMLAFSKVGFQTHRDRDKFVEMVNQYFGDEIKLQTEIDDVILIEYDGWTCSLGVFPVTIKNKDFLALANKRAVKAEAKEIRKNIFGENASYKNDDFRLFFAAERFDYTKGIRSKLNAFGEYLRKYPERRGKDVLFQLAVTNRREVDSYRHYQDECERIKEEINAKYEDARMYPNWKPIILEMEKFSRRKLVAHYLAMDVGVVTPRMDGMNLVSKEMLLCNPKAALILSVGAGSDYQFQKAGLYDENDPNPNFRVNNIHNQDGFAEIFHRAALQSRADRLRHGMVLNKFIRKNNIERWSRTFLNPKWSPLKLLKKVNEKMKN